MDDQKLIDSEVKWDFQNLDKLVSVIDHSLQKAQTSPTTSSTKLLIEDFYKEKSYHSNEELIGLLSHFVNYLQSMCRRDPKVIEEYAPSELFTLIDEAFTCNPPYKIGIQLCEIIRYSLYCNEDRSEALLTQSLAKSILDNLLLPVEKVTESHILALQRFTYSESLLITMTLVKLGCIPRLLDLLIHPVEFCLRNVCFCLSHVLSSGAEIVGSDSPHPFSEEILRYDGSEKLFYAFKRTKDKKAKREISRCLCFLWNGKALPDHLGEIIEFGWAVINDENESLVDRQKMLASLCQLAKMNENQKLLQIFHSTTNCIHILDGSVTQFYGNVLFILNEMIERSPKEISEQIIGEINRDKIKGLTESADNTYKINAIFLLKKMTDS